MGRKAVEMTGLRFGMLTVLGPVGKSVGKKGTVAWLCQCDCGKPPKAVNGASLRSGNAKSCGCKRGRKKKVEPENQVVVSEGGAAEAAPPAEPKAEIWTCPECSWAQLDPSEPHGHYTHCPTLKN